MKVLHIIPSLALTRGGPSHAVLAMVKALRAHNADAQIATTDDNGPELLRVPLLQRIEYEQVPVWFFHRLSPLFVFIREFCFSPSMTNWLWKHIPDFDLLHIHALFSYPSTMSMKIARIKHIPYIIRPAGLLEKYSLRQKSIRKQVYLNILERSNIEHSQAIHFTSEQESEQASVLGFKAPSFILPHGLFTSVLIPDARQKLRKLLKVPENEPIILFMSRLHPKKGLEYLVPALENLENQRFTFIIAGNGEPSYEAKIDKLLESSGISKRSHRIGFVTDEKKNLLLQGSDIFVLTSHSENFGVAVFEAMAAGLPVLVTQGVAAASLIKENECGYVVELDIPSIAFSIGNFLNNLEKEKSMGQRGRQLVSKEFNCDYIAVKLIEIYGNIVSGNNKVAEYR